MVENIVLWTVATQEFVCFSLLAAQSYNDTRYDNTQVTQGYNLITLVDLIISDLIRSK